MKAIGFVSGMALGMAAAVAAVSAVYPDIPKRAKRDTKHIWRSMMSKALIPPAQAVTNQHF